MIGTVSLALTLVHVIVHICRSNTMSDDTGRVIAYAIALAQRMAAAAVTFSCQNCGGVWYTSHRLCPKKCKAGAMLHVDCSSGWRGSYNYWRESHRKECGKCNTEMTQDLDEKRESKAEARSKALHDTSNGN